MVAPCLDHRFLYDVLGESSVTEDAERNVIDQGRVLGDETLEIPIDLNRSDLSRSAPGLSPGRARWPGLTSVSLSCQEQGDERVGGLKRRPSVHRSLGAKSGGVNPKWKLISQMIGKAAHQLAAGMPPAKLECSLRFTDTAIHHRARCHGEGEWSHPTGRWSPPHQVVIPPVSRVGSRQDLEVRMTAT